MKKTMFSKKILLYASIVMIIFLNSCTSNNNPSPNGQLAVITSTPSNITDTSAVLGGNATADGGKTITSKGVCIGLNTNPTVDDPNVFVGEMGTGLGSFSDDFSPFDPNTTYHVRAYATNADGTTYGDDESFTTDAPSACNIINVTPTNPVTISTPTTWTSGNVYVITRDVSVQSVLTIEPGVVVKLQSAEIDVYSSGRIIANGNASNRIVFTSYADDSHCGDTNGDGSATSPQKGDWTALGLYGGTGQVYNYCDFLYAGENRGGSYSSVYISAGATPEFTFDNCVFAHTLSGNNTASIAFYAKGGLKNNGNQFLTNNAFYDNDIPISMHPKYNLATSNIFHNPNNTTEKNRRNFIWTTDDLLSTAATWNISEIPYLVTHYKQISSPGALAIGANVVVKFLNTTHGFQRSTSTEITYSGSTIFTSYKDDVNGGDSNGDGNATSPVTGDWYGFRDPSIPGTDKFLHGSNIKYAAN